MHIAKTSPARKNLVFLDWGNIIYNPTRTVVNAVTLLIDKTDGTVLAWGPGEDVRSKYDQALRACREAGTPEKGADLAFLGLPIAGTTPEERCYILKRCVEGGASDFPKELCRHGDAGDAKAWLRAEMARVPLDLYARD